MPEPDSAYAGHRIKAFWKLNQLVDDSSVEFIVDKSFPGSGKTYRNLELIKTRTDLNFLVLAEAHTILDIYETSLPKSEVVHWRGFESSCLKIDIFRGIPPRIACSICKDAFPNTYSSCPYQRAFKEHKRVILAPLAYLQTKQLENIEPDIIIVEESLFNGKPIKPPDRKVIHLHSLALGRPLTPDDYITNWENITLELQEKILENIWHTPDLDFIRESVSDLFQQTPYEIGLYYKYKKAGVLPKPNITITLPYALLLFEYAQRKKAKVINTDASFNEAVWEMLKERSKTDPVFSLDLPNPKIIEIPIQKKSDSMVVRVVPKTVPYAKYTRQTLRNEHFPTLQVIAWKIAKIVEKYYPQFVIDNRRIVPIITYKQFEDSLRYFVQKELSKLKIYDLTVRTMHFGSSLRSSRDFEGLKFLFIVGTFTVGPDAFQEILLSYFLIDPDDIGLKSYQDKNTRWRYESSVYPQIDEIRKYWEEETQLQAIFRIRPLNEETVTFLFGLLPERLESTITVIQLDDVKKVKWYPKTPATLQLAVKKAKEFIQNYGDDFVPFSEVMSYLKSLGFAHMVAHRAVQELTHQFTVYTKKEGKRGRPKKYFLYVHS